MPPNRRTGRRGGGPIKKKTVKVLPKKQKTSKPNRHPENTTGIKVFITDDDFLKQRKKCVAYMKKCDKYQLKEPWNPFSVPQLCIEESTQYAYENCWKEMARFFYIIGDFQSAMLVDRKICPTDPLPFLPESFCLFMTYRCAQRGLPLLHPKTGKQVKSDVDGTLLTTVGGWNAPSMLGKMHSSVLFLHEQAYPETCSGAYVQGCTKCMQLNSPLFKSSVVQEEKEKALINDLMPENVPKSEFGGIHTCRFINEKFGFYKSCKKHANRPPLESSGNVLNHPTARNTYAAWYKIKSGVHVAKGNGQLYPADVRILRNFLLGEGDVASFQMYVMLIIGIKLFLRCDELLHLRVDNFRHSYSGGNRLDEEIPEAGVDYLTRLQVVNSLGIQSLVCEIQGKCDTKPKKLVLYNDDEYSEFCELRHLLWYMKMFNIQDGYLFPPPKVLAQQWNQNSFSPLMCEVPQKYQDFQRRFKKMIIQQLGRNPKVFIVGTHTMRKTAYLFAIWGFYFAALNPAFALPCKWDCIVDYTTYLS